VDFRLLGPLEVRAGDGPVPIGGPKQRTLLALLLLQPNRVVTVDRLTDAMWGSEPPATARNTLQTYVRHLRKALGAERIEHRSAGYVLVTDPNDVDLVRFESLVDEAHRLTCADPARAVVAFREAIGLWRGPALDDLAEQPSLRPEIARLEESRLAVVEEMVSTDLTLGRDRELVPELETLVHHHPFRERLWGQLMIALYRSGRQGDALAAYQRARRVLVEELGIDPSPDLQRIEQQILEQDAELEVTGEPLRGYRLIERIGEGPLAVVSRARQPHVEREVAIKVIPSEVANDPDFVRRFESEARLVARLEHPHAVPLYDYWRDPDGAYLVMRLLRGGSLREWIDRSGPLPAEAAAEMLEQVASALAAAHREGIIHRDLKPANILRDEDGNAYVSDFGIATGSSAARKTRSPPTGVPPYLAPEQTRGHSVTPVTDVYALGVVMYEALTARRPFVDRSPGSVVERDPCDGLPSVLSLRPDLPPAVDDVLARATEQDPHRRFGDAPSVAAAFRLAIGAPSAEPTRAPAREVANPYKGLRAFDEPDAPDFFGRERMTQRLLARLAAETEGSRLLAVVGPSGSGKSSLVCAGLLPALRRGALPGSDAWFVTSLVPGARPFEELEAALLRVAIDPPVGLAEQLQRDERGLLRAVGRILPPDDSTELVLVVDQLEELFTLTGRESERSAFLGALAQATTDRESRLRVILTLRADFYDRPLLDPRFGPLLAERTEAITPLVPDELERAIVGPADRVGVSLEPSLVAEMVADVAHQPGALPLLQYSLTELFGRRRDRVMTSAAYHELGGVSGALAARAEELFTAFDAAGREACRQMFLRLIAPGEGAEDTRRRVPRAELDAVEGEPGSMAFAIGAFGRHRLLSFDRDQLTREPTVELAHEALIRAWSRLRDWIDEGREDLRAHRRLVASTDEWLASGHTAGFLATGARLERLSSWVSETRVALGRNEREFVEESLRRQEEETALERTRVEHERVLERRSVRRMRALVAVLATAALVAATLTVVAANQRGRAERASRFATARELAGAATTNLDSDADRSLLLALQAVETTRGSDGTVPREAEEALHAALQAHRLLLSVPGVDHLEFSPDGSRLVTGGEDGAIHTYDTATGRPLLTIQDPEAAGGRVAQHDLHFSPDGALIASSSGTLWDAGSGEQVTALPFGGPASFSVPFSPDGRFVAAQGGSLDGTGVWDVATGEQVSGFEAYGYLAFSPDGRRLLIADNYQRDPELGWVAGYVVDLRQADGGAHRVVLLGHERANTTGATWSPDGSMVATSAATEVLVWDPSTAEREYTLTSDADFTSVTFSPDSRRIATGMGDGTAIVWTLSPDGAKPVLTVAGHEAGVGDVAFSPDGRRLATTGVDGAAKIWDVTSEGSREWLSVPGTQGVAYSPDGRVLAASTSDEEVPVPQEVAPGDVHLYDTDGGGRIATFPGHEDEIISLEFDPRGARLASAAQDGTARIWDVAGERPPLTLTEEIPGQPGALTPVVDVAFSPDGGTVATTTTQGGLIRTWDAATGARGLTLKDGSGNAVLGNWEVEFSPDGTRLAAPSGDAVYVWTSDTGRLVARLSHSSQASDLEFTPDGEDLITVSADGRLRVWDAGTWDEKRSVAAGLGQAQIELSPQGDRLATASADGIRLWDAETLEERLLIATGVGGQGAGVDVLAFSPDGSRLAVHTAGVVSVYALDIDDLVRLARQRLTRSWTEDECRTYLHLDECPSTTR
jgi:WD40 repeat protein/DNA-binding SARP family transcriptional activator